MLFLNGAKQLSDFIYIYRYRYVNPNKVRIREETEPKFVNQFLVLPIKEPTQLKTCSIPLYHIPIINRIDIYDTIR